MQIWAKRSYGRGAGTLMHCAAATPVEDAGLCYKACGVNDTGVGPVCWQACPASHPITCAAGCATDSDACDAALADQILLPLETVAEVFIEDSNAGETAMDTVNAYDLPLCDE